MKMEFRLRENTAIVFILIVNIMSPFFVIGQNPEIELRRKLFTKHSNAIRPVTNISHPVEINVTLELLNLFKFDTINGVLITQCSLELTWYDGFLSWDPVEYANISMLYVSAKEIWKPDITVCNSETQHLADNDINNMVLRSDGRVVLWYQEILHTFCNIDAKDYPFDKQHCDILIGVAIHKAHDTIIGQLYYRKAPFFRNYEWNVDMEGYGKSKDNTGRSLTEATALFSRKIKISTIAMMVPSVIFTVVSVFVFLLPVESGEKVSLAMTLLLSNIVYLAEIDKLIPKISRSMPLIAVYHLILTTWSGINTIGAIVECFVYTRRKRKDMRSNSAPVTPKE